MTSVSLHRRQSRREADFRGEAAPEAEVAAAQAWRRMCDRISPVIAVELGIGKELVEAYGNPRKGKYGPHLRLLQALQVALELRPLPRQRDDVFAPLDWIEAWGNEKRLRVHQELMGALAALAALANDLGPVPAGSKAPKVAR